MIDDARSFFQRAPSGGYALVVFGFLDSHRLLSAFSSVRLDNFIYTLEGMREVRRLLAPGGRAALSFASNEPWIHERLLALLDRGFERPSAFFVDQAGYANGILYLNEKGDAKPVPRRRALVPTDDWPFLYLRERAVPRHNLLFLAVAVALSAAALWLLPSGERRLRLPYFFLGAAFFLLETSNVVRMALLYGSTWWVNTVVFAGILLLVLLANLTAARFRVPLGACLALVALLILAAALVPSEALLATACLAPRARGRGGVPGSGLLRRARVRAPDRARDPALRGLRLERARGGARRHGRVPVAGAGLPLPARARARLLPRGLPAAPGARGAGCPPDSPSIRFPSLGRFPGQGAGSGTRVDCQRAIFQPAACLT